MPKIIQNIEKKINQATLKLLEDHNYQSLNMKLIAQEAEMAVGTLYNYYQNKEELFLAVFKQSWQKTFAKLDQILSEQKKEKNILVELVISLYNEICQRKGIGSEIIKADIFNENDITVIKKTLRSKFKSALKILEQNQKIELKKAVEIRLIDSLILTTVHLATDYSEQKEENIEFIKNIIQKI